jgi:Leucine-rich repeat (LRR) protein
MASNTPTGRVRREQPFEGHAWPVRIRTPGIIERADYRGQKCLEIESSVLGVNYPSRERKRIQEEWFEFFRSPQPVRELSLWLRVSQEFFDLVCQQRALQRLYVKWGPVTDLSAVRNLPHLDGLSLGTTSVRDLSPLGDVLKLKYLQLENLKQVVDFSALARCRQLESLRIDGFREGPQKIKVRDLQFVSGLTRLRALAVDFVIIEEFDVQCLLGLKNLEYLDLPSVGRAEQKRLKEFSHQIRETLPNLRFGNVVECDPATADAKGPARTREKTSRSD